VGLIDEKDLGSKISDIFRFLGLVVVSLPCGWSWALRLSSATIVAPLVLGAQESAHANVCKCVNGVFI
jgi:hypothetical protein